MGPTKIDAAAMVKGKRLAAIFAVIAIAATVADVLADRAGDSSPEAEGTAGEAAADAAATAAELARPMAAEVSSAAAVPQLRAALRARVDAATISDLFASEDWWLPFRERAVSIVTGAGLLLARAAGDTPADASLAGQASARPGQPVVALKKVGTGPGVVVVLEGAVVVPEIEDAPVLVLARTVKGADLARVAASRGRVALAVADADRVLLASESWAPMSPLGGRELAPTGVTDGTRVAAAASLGGGLWLWAQRPRPPSSSRRSWILLALAGLSALAALGSVAWAAVFSRRRRPAPGARTRPLAAAGAGGARLDDEASSPAVDVVPRTVSSIGSRPLALAIPIAIPAPPAGASPGERRASPSAETQEADQSALQMFGRYALIERIGEGGMSEVYTASMRGAEGFHRTVVVKRLKPALARNRSAVDQFIDEARLGSLLSHPNIVQVLDFGKVDDGHFMALEHIQGRDLGQIVERKVQRTGAPLEVVTVLHVAHEVLQGLAYAHGRTDERGRALAIVHRDVSPGNVVVSLSGDVKLIDFGIVKAHARLSRTNLGNVKGNPAFMSPEQARGGAVDARSDLFSVGLVMYYGLTGRLPYGKGSSAEAILRAANGLGPDALERLRGLPPAVGRVLHKALAMDPKRRFQTAAAFAAAIEPHLGLGSPAATAMLMQALFGGDVPPSGDFAPHVTPDHDRDGHVDDRQHRDRR